MIHSYSALATWRQCPRLHKAQYIDKSIPYEETPAMTRGNRLHKAMEEAVEGGGPIPDDMKGDVNRKLATLFQRTSARAEVKVAVNRDGAGCHFFDKGVWLRGKVDVYQPLKQRKAVIAADWKSGNPNYTDELQADVYAGMFHTMFGFDRTLFIWPYFSGEHPAVNVDGQEAWQRVTRLMHQVEADDAHPPIPCWKCRFCPLTSCEYNKRED